MGAALVIPIVVVAGTASVSALIAVLMEFFKAPGMSAAQAAAARKLQTTDLCIKKQEKQKKKLQDEMDHSLVPRSDLEVELHDVQASIDALTQERDDEQAALLERYEEEQRRLRGIGMDNINDFNFAFVGGTGVGKSTLVTCLRGLRADDPRAAPASAGCVGTMVSGRYPHPYLPHVALWDIPGGGDGFHPTESYWTDQCLDLFDAIILVIDGRMTEVASLVLKKAVETARPFAVVQTKTRFHLLNMADEAGLDEPTTAQKMAFRAEIRSALCHPTHGIGARGATAPLFLVDSPQLRNGIFKYDELELIAFMVGCTAARLPVPVSPEELAERFRSAARLGALHMLAEQAWEHGHGAAEAATAIVQRLVGRLQDAARPVDGGGDTAPALLMDAPAAAPVSARATSRSARSRRRPKNHAEAE